MRAALALILVTPIAASADPRTFVQADAGSTCLDGVAPELERRIRDERELTELRAV